MELPICPSDRVSIFYCEAGTFRLFYGYGVQPNGGVVVAVFRLTILGVVRFGYGDALPFVRDANHLFGIQVHKDSDTFNWPHVEVGRVLERVALDFHHSPPFFLLPKPPRRDGQAGNVR